jgi:PAS domain S-box-containing protein
MTLSLALASFVGRGLLLLTLAAVAHAAWRRKDRHRLDILALVAALALVQFLPPTPLWLGLVRLTIISLQPLLLLRLVMHFAAVPRLFLWTAAAAVPVVPLTWIAWPDNVSTAWLGAGVNGYTALVGAFVAAALLRETRATSGVSKRRLWYAAAGTWIFVATLSLAAPAPFGLHLLGAQWTTAIARALNAPMMVCYFLAFSTPRRLAARWQQIEQARYLTFIAARDPEERGALAAEDLNRAAAGGVSNALTFVALRADDDPMRLRIAAAGDPALAGLEVEPTDGLIAGAWRDRARASGAVDDCQPALAGRLRPFGARVLVAPIATRDDAWGVVAAVQRRGSLFPEDDLDLLVEFGRHAGTALDHARLVNDARARERRAAGRRLREVESRMSLMLDSIKDYAMMILDHHGRVVNWPVGSNHVFGYRTEEVVDEPAAPLFVMADEPFDALLREARQLGRARREGPCRRRDGGTFLGHTVIRPLEVDEDGLVGFVAVTRDVSEQRALEDRLRQSQKMEAIGQLAGGVAHDFNNLLTAILGYSDLLAAQLPSDDPRRAHLTEIQQAADRAAGLTRQLLTFSRGQMLQPEVVNMARMVSDMVPMLRRVLGEHIEIIGHTGDEVLPVLADRTQIEQVVLNLAVNARDAMPEGGTLNISTTNAWLDDAMGGYEASPGRYVLLEVADTGSGIDEATRARIFEPFFTTKEPGRGTGLGLATVYGIVRQMGGIIRVDSEPGRGAAFRLYVPATDARVEPVPAPIVRDVMGHETILLVEDDGAVRRFVRQVLEEHGYEVLEAEDQVAALAVVEQHRGRIDLVVTDVLMPRGTGPELVRALAQLLPALPALFISGYADAALARQVTFPKASHFLQKPFSAADLLARIRQILSSTA